MKKLSVLLALLLVLSLSVPAVASAASAEPVRVFTLNGTTGFGLAGLIAENKDGGASQEYSFSVETDASNVTALQQDRGEGAGHCTEHPGRPVRGDGRLGRGFVHQGSGGSDRLCPRAEPELPVSGAL